MPSVGLPALSVVPGQDGGQEYSLSLQILALMSAITLLPSLLLGATAFHPDHHSVVYFAAGDGHAANAAQSGAWYRSPCFSPSSLCTRRLRAIYEAAVSPYLEGQIEFLPALESASVILKEFLVLNTREAELAMFAELAGDAPYQSNSDVPFNVLMPAFLTSELKTAFQIGFLLFLPFLVIDMVIASVLMSLGMMMLSPILISLPFKLLLFVLVDGWAMTIGSISSTYMN